MSPSRALLLTAAAVTAPLLVACSGSDASEHDGVNVVTSTNVYADVARAVGGDDVDVTAFIDSPSADPHSYEANSRNILTVTRADLVIENGGGYDDFMDTLLDSAKNDPAVINAVATSGAADGAAGDVNEHVWYDLETMQKVATVVAEELSTIDPAHADEYAANADAFNAQVQQLIDEVADLSKLVSGTPVAITEPVPGYLLDDLGLENLTPAEFSEAIEEGEDVSVGVLDETLRLFSDDQVAALIYNEQTTGPVTEQIQRAAEDAGIPIVGVAETMPDDEAANGETNGYVSWMSDNVDAIAAALDQP